jgi:glycosyltransferase involved in cell wall biosynthesis
VHNSPFVAALRPTKTLVHLHNEVRFPGYDRLQGRYRKAHYACCSDYIRSWLLDTYSGLDESSVHTLYNAADITRFHPLDGRGCVNHPPRLLFAGQWDERKGIFILLEAASLLEERGAEFELWIAGSAGLWQSDSDKARSDEIEARVRNRANALANVRIVGLVNHDKMPDLYRSVDIMVIPSIWDEPSALTLSESMASGLPVIAFSVGGNSEMVLDGETGFLIEEQTPDALAEAIASLLDRPEEVRRMGQAARARAVAKFSWRAHLKRLWELYRLVNPSLQEQIAWEEIEV